MRHRNLALMMTLALATTACGDSTSDTPTTGPGAGPTAPAPIVASREKVAIPEARRQAIAETTIPGYSRPSGRPTPVGASLYFVATEGNAIGRKAEIRVHVTGCGGSLCGPVVAKDTLDTT